MEVTLGIILLATRVGVTDTTLEMMMIIIIVINVLMLTMIVISVTN